MTPVKKISIFCALLTVAPLICRGSYHPMRDVVTSIQQKTFKGKSPEEIARFLAHPDETTQKAAVAALADTPDAAIPLVEKLLGDTNPWIRAGAVDVLAKMLDNAEKAKRTRLDAIPRKRGWTEEYHRIKDEDTTEEALALDLLNKHLADETSDPVLFSICELFTKAKFDPDAMRPFVDKAAQSPDPIIWEVALRAYWIENKQPEALLRTTLMVMENHELVTNEETLLVTMMLREGAKGENGADAIPVVAEHLLNTVNGSEAPIRKKAWYQVVDRELTIIENEWKNGVEGMPNVIPALCRSMVRLPYNLEGRQAKPQLRAKCKALLERCGSASAGTIRDWAAKEAAWLEAVSPEEFQRVLHSQRSGGFKAEETREYCQASIAFLNDLANRLEAKQTMNHEPEKKEN